MTNQTSLTPSAPSTTHDATIQGAVQGAVQGSVDLAAVSPPSITSPQKTEKTFPAAHKAFLRLRHYGLMISFGIMVILPIIVTITYLWGISKNQYASIVGFTVQREETQTTSTMLGGIASQFVGGVGNSESNIIYEFIQSQEMVAAIHARMDLTRIYGQNWLSDPVFSLWPNATIEDLVDYWQRMIHISYDNTSHLLELRVQAFSAQDAQKIAEEIIAESQRKINDLNIKARDDLMRYAKNDLITALTRLKDAREALTAFRTRTQIVDPVADIQGRMGVLYNLQQQLAQALIENDIVQSTTNQNDPRRAQSERRIEVIQDRITAERANFSKVDETNIDGENYPKLISEYESLMVDARYAEETYRVALAEVDNARSKASRQTIYLSSYINPTFPESSEYPQYDLITALVAFFATLIWAISALIFYSIRDRR